MRKRLAGGVEQKFGKEERLVARHQKMVAIDLFLVKRLLGYGALKAQVDRRAQVLMRPTDNNAHMVCRLCYARLLFDCTFGHPTLQQGFYILRQLMRVKISKCICTAIPVSG